MRTIVPGAGLCMCAMNVVGFQIRCYGLSSVDVSLSQCILYGADMETVFMVPNTPAAFKKSDCSNLASAARVLYHKSGGFK